MPNHFHFLLRIRHEETLARHFLESATLSGFKTLTGLPGDQKMLPQALSRQFSHLFNGYTQAFNKQYNRRGNLFIRPYKRIAVTNTDYLRRLVIYIHQNPVNARLSQNPRKWPYSSYNSIINENDHFLRASEVISWFNHITNFELTHTSPSFS